ncbi:tRNA threonylcarbamoyladenosine dehydratase [Ottowia thiooxydans]|uniref:tRNA threonylcarbamoyladenosine dehydratase n=1 Tax=Ottowia thiooxydans TaxID=219182 RepID=UPI0004202666|nr:tRNA threonylcarbamoyladenosine dehydratase [Ottowia thiooxydans]
MLSLADTAIDTSPDLERRFGGLSRLYGVEGAKRIRAAHVAVVGIGGVGSWAAEALARSGVGQITLIDMDHISESNVNRQIHAVTSTLGQAKVEAMRERIAQIHPGCVVHTVDAFAEPGNWPQILPTSVDAVIDACDQVVAKVAMAAWARRERRSFISVGAAGGKLRGDLVEAADIADATHDPLLAQVRYRLRREHGAPSAGKRIGVRCIFSRESVALPPAVCEGEETDGTLNCHGYGSTVAVTATFGFCAAGELLNEISKRA